MVKTTKHFVKIEDSTKMSSIDSNSVQLIVTSPPYPMIAMWDDMFKNVINIADEDFLKKSILTFKLMHRYLRGVWEECDRVLVDGGFICINIGDAVRTINETFQMFPNHCDIIEYFILKGYSVLPDIHWRKVTNAPNKFMGSGMYPAGAYVTYEHEYILIFRKGSKRIFNEDEKQRRRESAYFWEERNVWFSDLWQLSGVNQKSSIADDRSRNASYPFEIPYRLINMYSIKGDTVLDPFSGFGTTSLAAMASERNSIGLDVSENITTGAINRLNDSKEILNDIIQDRLLKHSAFINTLPEDKIAKCYNNPYIGLVKTKQEKDIIINPIKTIVSKPNYIEVLYGSLSY